MMRFFSSVGTMSFPRPLLTMIMLVHFCHFEVTVQAEYYVEKDQGLQNKALDGEHIFLSSLQTTGAGGCFAQCLTRCRCMTFQVCNETQCQLLSSNRFIKPSALQSKLGCTYYDMLKKKTPQPEAQKTQEQACKHGINCCRMSNPCLNGGTCTPTFAEGNTPRFKCSCSEDFHGNRCQYELAPVSCRGYNKTRTISSGIYKIRNSSMETFKAYCDFDYNTSMAWTLIQSYQLQREPELHAPFIFDWPVNQDTPSWDIYRLSSSRINSIHQDSTKWRMTCNFDTEGLVYRDYVLGPLADIDIVSSFRKCVKVDYVNIRGQSCKECTIHGRQGLYKPFHFDANHHSQANDSSRCDFHVTGEVMCNERKLSEDNFGHYKCVNPVHRCTASNMTTTQTWLGGEFKVFSNP